jgi:DNA phosphorothioation-associated putative methyltransferase
MKDGLLGLSTEVLDYGCGHGDDVKRLEQAGIRAFGWDPAHRPDGARREADVVNLGYVVNVVENPEERAQTLRSAWNYTRGVLIVSARLKSEAGAFELDEFEDGCVTRLGTFQKFYEQRELRDWIQETLGESPIAAAPGIFYVFRRVELREQFIASRYRRRLAAPRIRLSDRLFEEHQELLRDLMHFVTERGRLPEAEEVQAGGGLVKAFGSIKRAFQVVRRVTGAEHWQAIAEERRTDLLVYLALGRFPRRPKFSSLPRPIQLDIKGFFKTYNAACTAGDQLLFQAGDMQQIDSACRQAAFGKLMPTALYVHISALNRLPPLLRVYEACARVLCGEIEGATIVKLRRDEPKVSYLCYPAFDADEHPTLSSSMRVDLRTLDVRWRDFTKSTDPPILHRKESFVPDDYPRRELFAALTKAEEGAGLFENVADIGTLDKWNRRLAAKGLKIVDHEIVKRP